MPLIWGDFQDQAPRQPVTVRKINSAAYRDWLFRLCRYRSGGYLRPAPARSSTARNTSSASDIPAAPLPLWLASLLTKPGAGFVTPAPTSASSPRWSRNTRAPVARV